MLKWLAIKFYFNNRMGWPIDCPFIVTAQSPVTDQRLANSVDLDTQVLVIAP